MSARIALLEDDASQANALQAVLEKEGMQCIWFDKGESLISSFRHDSFDLLITDWFLPDMTGDRIVEWVRNHVDWRVPILVVTVRDDEENVVRMLNLGADDYVVKPIRPGELVARVQALLRRSSVEDKETGAILDFGVFQADTENRVIKRDGKVIDLTTKEFELSLFLFRNAGRLVSRGHMLNEVWGYSPDLNTRTVDTHVSRVRQKLQLDPASGWRLRTVYQHGYRLEPVDATVASAG